jgi:uroporphyrinogen-III synthase
MRPPLLLLRPEPGATAGRAARAGWEVVKAPLFTVLPCAWDPPDPADFDALMLTSANAVRHAGPRLASYRRLPVYAVGAATAAAAQDAGFADVHAGNKDAAALVELAADRGAKRLLHLAGREHRAVEHPRIDIQRRIVYAAEPVAELPAAARAALPRGPIALLHSPRAARCVAARVGARGGGARVALSPATLAAAGLGWREAVAADAPTDDALLAAAARLCE